MRDIAKKMPQFLLTAFTRLPQGMASRYPLRKTEVLLQPKAGACFKKPAVTIGSDNLKAVTKFCYLEGALSNDCSVDSEITARIAKASSTFDRLASRLWNTLTTKVLSSGCVNSTALRGRYIDGM